MTGTAKTDVIDREATPWWSRWAAGGALAYVRRSSASSARDPPHCYQRGSWGRMLTRSPFFGGSSPGKWCNCW